MSSPVTLSTEAVRDSVAPIADNNRYNNVFFSGSLYGHNLGSSTLAVTTTWYRVSTGVGTKPA